MDIKQMEGARESMQFRPSLLLFAPFMASAIIYSPVMRVLDHSVTYAEVVKTFFLAMIIAAAVFSVVLTLRVVRVRDLSITRATSAACALGYSLVQALLVVVAMSDALQAFVAISVVLGVLSAVFAGGVVATWVGLFSFDFRSVMLNGAAACALCAVLLWLLSVASPTMVRIAMPLLAVAGSFGAVILMNPGNVSPTEQSLGADRLSAQESQSLIGALSKLLSVIWLPLLGLMLCVFMMNLYSIDAAGISVSESCGCLIASSLVVALCVGCKKTPLVVAVDKLALPACAALSMVFGAFPLGTPMFFLGAYTAYAPLVFISIYALATILPASRSGEFPPGLAFGTLVLTASIVALTGFALACEFGSNSVACGTVLWVMLCIYFAIVMLNLGFGAWRQMVRPLGDEALATEQSGDSRAEEDALMNRLHAERVAELALERGLTSREQELLDYMSRGHNSSYIAQVLFISPSTVRTHFRNIYRKLGVNSREELLALFNASENSR